MQTPRPFGPRPIARSASPAMHMNDLSLALPETRPLEIRKPRPPNLAPPSSSSPAPSTSSSPRPPPPTLSLGIPRPPRSSSNTPRPQISLAIPAQSGIEYYDGPVETASHSGDHPEEVTIKPNISLVMPESQAQTRTPPEPLADIREILTQVNSQMPPQPASSSQNTADLDNSGEHEEENDAIRPSPVQRNQTWSDDAFEELSRLGEGAGGAVHKVKDRRTNMIMARKTITTREAPMKQLLREIVIISSTAHMNITRFYGAYISPSSSEVKILMEFCEGGSLESIGKKIKERRAVVGEKIAGRLAEGVLQGLAYLHTKKTIHRDIKPSNILLSREGIVKLCDFGVSGELIDSRAGTFTGTGMYMAPERIVAQPYTIRSDVWSAGISLLELVQNKFPFPPDLPPIDLMMYITQAEPPRLEDESDIQWSDEMKDFIKQTLMVNPEMRPTPKDMLAHPWIVSVMKQEVHMARWVRQVWNWPKPNRKSKDNASGSRPSSSRRVDSGGEESAISPEG